MAKKELTKEQIFNYIAYFLITASILFTVFLLANNKMIVNFFNDSENKSFDYRQSLLVKHRHLKPNKDIMIVALLIHDGLKKGNPEEKYTLFDHPILAAKYAEDMQSKTSLTDAEVKLISHVVKTHMGKWNTDYNGNEILEVPKDRYQYFVHMCDYLSSRKVINVTFDDKGEII